MSTVVALKPALTERPATTLFMHLGAHVMLIATLPRKD